MTLEVRATHETIGVELGQRTKGFVEGLGFAIDAIVLDVKADGGKGCGTGRSGAIHASQKVSVSRRIVDDGWSFCDEVIEEAPQGWWGTALPPADWRGGEAACLAADRGVADAQPAGGGTQRGDPPPGHAQAPTKEKDPSGFEEAVEAIAAKKDKNKDKAREKRRRKRARESSSLRASSRSRAKKKGHTSKKDKKSKNESKGKHTRRSPSTSLVDRSQAAKRGVPIARVSKWRCGMFRFVNFGIRAMCWECSSPPPPEVKRLQEAMGQDTCALTAAEVTQFCLIVMDEAIAGWRRVAMGLGDIADAEVEGAGDEADAPSIRSDFYDKYHGAKRCDGLAIFESEFWGLDTLQKGGGLQDEEGFEVTHAVEVSSSFGGLRDGDVLKKSQGCDVEECNSKKIIEMSEVAESIVSLSAVTSDERGADDDREGARIAQGRAEAFVRVATQFRPGGVRLPLSAGKSKGTGGAGARGFKVLGKFYQSEGDIPTEALLQLAEVRFGAPIASKLREAFG
ncbi:unnamed protein product [Prorocentrum cordatum]|uniref:Uncharacterized protein n=1 Tax=Prorocentrum cordatum TaxID=2364126 RepID=A0ABN9QSK1_9DINO|nr:unnamed protein product [Polarella glacialis]